jgi:oxygen-independent coproporphyrinogen-3 oxidase
MFEPGTPLTELRDKGYLKEMDDMEESIRYHEIRRTLTHAGYEHYEISKFARPSYSCRHNLGYWSGGEYLGCGPSAHSHWQGRRFGNARHLSSYCDALLNGKTARSEEETLAADDKAREGLVMSLRQLAGVDAGGFERSTGYAIRELGGDGLDQLIDLGMLEWREERLLLTENALFVSDAVFAELV